MKKLWILIVASVIASCNLFVSKEKKTEQLVNQELRHIDWETVDEYPLFYSCDETASKSDQKSCFENELIHHLTATLKQFEYTVNPDIDSKIYVVFLIDKEGKITVIDIEKDKGIGDQMPEFDGIIRQSLKNLPEIAPALKRGIPVDAKFGIPIVLNTK